MAILKVARMGHPVLRAKARSVDPARIREPVFQKLIDDMIETMQEYQGIGLAAPQVHESLRLFVAGFNGDETPLRLITLINPEVERIGHAVEEDWEGCLSIPDIRGRVPRSAAIRVGALDRHGDRVSMSVTGYPARVIQHEVDHLDGLLFVDRMTSFETLTFLDEHARFWSPRHEPNA